MCWRVIIPILLILGIAPATGQEFQHRNQNSRPPRANQQDTADRFFESTVRPLLHDHCVKCHGPEKQESGLRVDDLSHLLKGGDSGPAVVPGRPESSLLLQAVRHEGDLEMPPDKKLDPKSIQQLAEWIETGAHWPANKSEPSASEKFRHWAFHEITPPSIPDLPAQYDSVTHPVDRFVLDRALSSGFLEKGIQIAPLARPSVLVRRAFHDLHGLAPSYDAIQSFKNDPSRERWDRLINDLLASTRYGERQARLWMDVARYADNKGYVFFEDKNYPWAYTYRDWLIEAFNEDMPYDRFVTCQLAADLMPEAGTSQKNLPALGFLTVGAHFVNNVHDQIDDRIDVVCRGLMGLTVTCSRCHDHKFDPISQRDYYALYGVFRSCYEPVVLPTFRPEPDTPEYRDYRKGLEERVTRLDEFVRKQREMISSDARKRIGEYLMAVHRRRNHPSTENFMTLVEKGGLIPIVISRYESFLKQARKRKDPVWIAWDLYSQLPDDSFALQAPEIASTIRQLPDSVIHPVVRNRLRDLVPQKMEEIAQVYADIFSGFNDLTDQQLASLRPETRILAESLYGPDAPAVLPQALGWGFLDLIPDRPTQAEYKKVLQEVESFSRRGPHAPPRAMVMFDLPRPFEPYVFLRGNPNRRGPSVPRRFLNSIPAFKTIGPDFPENGSGRLELAKAIVSRKNPLTARVLVNRVWQQHFGYGLVRTPSDFGLQGDRPSHPELLDWLANWFIQQGWSLKKLHRLIMTSETYRRQSGGSDILVRHDPENRLLMRQNRRRMDFETMRDSMLQAAGKLETKIGGPSFNLFGGFKGRRTVYGFIDRMDLPGVLRTFDYPEPMATSGARETTTVPAQALYLMNHDFVSQCAENILHQPRIRNAKNVDEKTAKIFRCILGRDPDPREVLAAERFLSKNQPRIRSAWEYGYGELDEQRQKVLSFDRLKHFVNGRWQGGRSLPDPQLNWLYHKRDESHPGASLKLCSIRRWTAPADSVVSVSAKVRHEPEKGNGVNCHVICCRRGSLGSQTVYHTSKSLDITELPVRKGDTLDFVADFNGEISFDQHHWAIRIETVEEPKTAWDSVREFQGQESDRFQVFAHALLMTNEFVFVD